MVAIEARNLERSFGKTMALADVSFEVPQNAVYTLIGSNGAGKSTLIQILTRLLEATGGEAWMDGTPVSELFGERWQRIGYVSEEQKWPGWMTMGGLLRYLRPFYPTWDEGLEKKLLDGFQLPLNRRLKSLSRGMRMKAAFAATLPFRPSILVLDEPLSGLDPLVRDELVDSLQTLRREGAGFTTFLSSHDLGEVENFATHVGFLDQGRMLFSEEMAELKTRYRKMSFSVEEDSEQVSNGLVSEGLGRWMLVTRDGAHVEIVHDAYSDGAEAEIAAVFPGARDVVVEAMPLRAIFLATAKARRAARVKPVKGGEPA